MALSLEVILVFVLVFLLLLVLLGKWSHKTRQVDVDRSDAGLEKPDWIQSTVPAETLTRLKEDGEPYQLFDFDPGEKLASPFAEQIEDIFKVMLKQDPELAKLDVDLGTGIDGRLDIWIDGELFTDVDEIPDPRVQEIFRKAVARWNSEH